MKGKPLEKETYIGNTDKAMIQFIHTVQSRISELLQEMGVAVLDSETTLVEDDRLQLQGLTALITVEDIVKMAISFSYEQNLIHKIFQEYTADIEVDKEEVELMKEETAGDFINVVIGNILAKFQKNGVAIELSIPLVVNGAKTIKRYKKSKVCKTKLVTEYGNLYVYCMVPLKLSLQHLLGDKEDDNA